MKTTKNDEKQGIRRKTIKARKTMKKQRKQRKTTKTTQNEENDKKRIGFPEAREGIDD